MAQSHLGSKLVSPSTDSDPARTMGVALGSEVETGVEGEGGIQLTRPGKRGMPVVNFRVLWSLGSLLVSSGSVTKAVFFGLQGTTSACVCVCVCEAGVLVGGVQTPPLPGSTRLF